MSIFVVSAGSACWSRIGYSLLNIPVDKKGDQEILENKWLMLTGYVYFLLVATSFVEERSLVFRINFSRLMTGRLHGLSGSAVSPRPLAPGFEAYLIGVSSLTWLRYLWRSLDPFSLPCAQKWP